MFRFSGGKILTCRDCSDQITDSLQRTLEVEVKYAELIFSIKPESVREGETRHEAALRILQENQ